MSKYARRMQIGAPSADVWATMVDVESWPIWASQFERLERLDAGPLALGSRVRVKPRRMPAAVWKVSEYEEGRSFTWESSLAPGVRIIAGHVVMGEGDAADVEFWLDAEGALSGLLAPVLRRTIFSRNTRSATEGLKRHMERSRRASGV